MIHHYTFRNFYSFLDETTVDFRVPKTLRGPSVTDEHLSKVMAIVGANGSGKTNLIKALAFLHWFVCHSFEWKPDQLIPFEQHFFSKDTVSSFEDEFSVGGETWRYTLELTPERVLHEALHQRNKSTGYFGYVFERYWADGAYAIKQQGFGMAPSEAKKVRQNASLISTALQYNVPIARTIAGFMVFPNVSYTGRMSMGPERIFDATNVFKENDTLHDQAVELLQEWDLGLSDVVIKEVTAVNGDGTNPRKRHAPFGVHRLGEDRVERMLLQESSGTQGAYVLLSVILPTLDNGGVAVIDELEADLHPRMLTPIMDLFLSRKTNPHDAQIIFTCHAAEILNLLQKQQIMLLEKDEQGNSEAWRLDSVQGVRKDDNLYAKYMAGAFGAVPQV